MDWNAIGAVGEILGAGAVFLSLGYLAVQVKVASATTKQSSQNAYVSDYHHVLVLLAQDTELTDLLRRGFNEGLAVLDGNEQTRFHYLAYSEYMRTLNMYRQLQSKQFDPEIGEPLVGYFAMMCRTKGGSEWWSFVKTLAGADRNFIEYIESQVENPNLPDLQTALPWMGQQ